MDAKKILVVSLGRIGDLVLNTPVLRALKQRDPDHELHLLAGQGNCGVVSHHPYLDRVHVYTKRPVDSIALVARLRRERFDWWIDPKDHGSSESRWFARLVGAPVRVGFNPGGRGPFNVPVKSYMEQEGVHATRRALSALHALGIREEDNRPVLGIPPAAADRLRRFLTEHGIARYAFVNISGTDAKRHWPVESWIALLDRIRVPDRDYLICCMPKDRERAGRILDVVAGSWLYPTETIEAVLPAVDQAEIVLSVDTSIIHISSAFNKPLLGLFANYPKEFPKYYPLSDHARCVRAPQMLAEVKDISVEQALEAYASLVDSLG